MATMNLIFKTMTGSSHWQAGTFKPQLINYFAGFLFKEGLPFYWGGGQGLISDTS